MGKNRFNWQFAVVLLLCFVVLGLTLFGLWGWRRKHTAQQGLKHGNQAYTEERWEAAAQDLGRYIARHPDDVPVLMKYARAKVNIRPIRRNQIQQALNAYRTVLRLDKENIEAGNTLTEMYLQIKEPAEAEHVARQILQYVDEPEIHARLALAMIQQRQYSQAADELKKLIQKHPEFVFAYEIIGQLTERRPEQLSQDSAESWFQKAVKNNPNSVDAYLSRAEYYFNHNRKAEAMADLAKVESLNPTDVRMLLRLTNAYSNGGEPDKAQRCFLAAEKSAAKDVRIWQTAAVLAQRSQDRKQMAQVAENGLKELGYQRWDFMPTAIELFIRSDCLDQAQECIAQMRREDTAPIGLDFYEGLIADHKGQINQAIKLWNKALENNAKLPQVRQSLAWALWKTGDRTSALHHLRTASNEDPDNSDLYQELSRMSLQIGQWDEAVQYAQKAVNLTPNDIRAAILYYRALMHLYNETEPDPQSPAWAKIEKELNGLARSNSTEPELKELQFQIAVRRRDIQKAENVLAAWKPLDAEKWPTAMAEVDLLIARNDSDQAADRLRSIIRDYPNVIEPVRVLAMLRADETPDEIEKTIHAQIRNIADPQKKKELILMMVSLYDQWRKPDKAYAMLAAYEKEFDEDIQIKRQLLRYPQEIADSAKAQKRINQIKSLEGEDGWQWRYEQAKLWLGNPDARENKNLEEYQQIVALLKENLRTNPDNLESMVLLAHTYRISGERSLAVTTFRDCYNRAPNQLAVIIPMVAVLYQTGEYDQANKIIDRATQQQLAHPLLSRYKLQNYMMMGKVDTSVQILEDMLQDDPENQEFILMLASLKAKQNRFDEAESLLNNLKAKNPDSLPVAVQQINLKIKQGKPDQAVALCDQLIEKNKSESAYLIRAQTLVNVGRLEDARKDIDQAITLVPDNVEAWVARYDLYNRTGQPDQAVQAIQRAMSLAPENIEIQKKAVSLYLASNRPELVDEGKKMLEKAVRKYPHDADLMLQQVRFLLNHLTRPNMEQAEDILQKISAENPKIAEVWVLQGDLALRAGQPGKAIDLALRGLALLPKDKNLLLLKARAEKTSSPLMAMSSLKTLHEFYPKDVDVILQLADNYILTGDFEKARLLLTAALADSSEKDRKSLQIVLATVNYYTGAREKAMKELDSLAAATPDDPYPFLTQARLLSKERRWSDLVEKTIAWYQTHPKNINTILAAVDDWLNSGDPEAFNSARQILNFLNTKEPQNTAILKILAIAVLNDGKIDEAVAIYRKVLDQNPDDPVTCNNLAWILCEKQNDYKNALKLVNQGFKKSPPEYIDIMDTRGVIQYRLGDYKKAFDDFTRCVELYPPGTPALAGAYFHMGLTLINMDRRDEAAKCFRQALDLHKNSGGLSDVDKNEAQRMFQKLSQGV